MASFCWTNPSYTSCCLQDKKYPTSRSRAQSLKTSSTLIVTHMYALEHKHSIRHPRFKKSPHFVLLEVQVVRGKDGFGGEGGGVGGMELNGCGHMLLSRHKLLFRVGNVDTNTKSD